MLQQLIYIVFMHIAVLKIFLHGLRDKVTKNVGDIALAVKIVPMNLNETGKNDGEIQASVLIF